MSTKDLLYCSIVKYCKYQNQSQRPAQPQNGGKKIREQWCCYNVKVSKFAIPKTKTEQGGK